MKTQIFETNAGLGYKEKAFLLHFSESDYICIGLSVQIEQNIYSLGELVDDVNILDLEISHYQLRYSPLFNSFLFKSFLHKNNISPR